MGYDDDADVNYSFIGRTLSEVPSLSVGHMIVQFMNDALQEYLHMKPI